MRTNKKRAAACAAVLSSSLTIVTPVFATGPACTGLMPPEQTELDQGKRDVTAEDVARLRDIGPEYPLTAPVSPSPEGKSVALQLIQGDPESNSHCLGVLVVSIRGKSPILLDKDGELIRDEISTVSGLTMESGIPKVIVPQWSKDGKWVAFLKRVGGSTQVWKAAADGSGSAPLTNSPLDVEGFDLLDDGRTLVFSTRPALSQRRRRLIAKALEVFILTIVICRPRAAGHNCHPAFHQNPKAWI